MNTPQIIVNIIGAAKTGKTGIAVGLGRLLRTYGINIEINGEDTTVGRSIDTEGILKSLSGKDIQINMVRVSKSNDDQRANDIVEAILEDLQDRSGIGNALDECDQDIKNEMETDLVSIVKKKLNDSGR